MQPEGARGTGLGSQEPALQLLNEGWRYRDLETGTFLTRDPLGFVEGPNMYSYVVDNPWTKFDPEGLEAVDAVNNPQQFVSRVNVERGYKVATATAVGVGVTVATGGAAAPVVASVGLTGTTATVATGVIAGAAGGAATQATSNALNGRPVGENTGKAALTGGAIGGAAALAGETAQAFKAGMQQGVAPTASASTTKAATDELVEVYRGVGKDHPGYSAALEGKAKPQGGHSDPELHNSGDTQSEFTSWTTNRGVADTFANKNGPGGVVLKDQVPKSKLTESPDAFKESEVLRKGPVEKAKVEKPKSEN